jgi:ribokinase
MNILVSGLLNTETTTAVRGFPIGYYPIDYAFFGVNTAVSGVAFNLAKALTTLGDSVVLTSMTGKDFAAAYICDALKKLSIGTDLVLPKLEQTPSSVVLYDPDGKRQIYCDLKDIQETSYAFSPRMLENVDLVAACNINFNRPLLHLAKQAGKIIATDVHVLSDVYDEYNREFMEYADILFLSDEAVGDGYWDFIRQLADAYPCQIIVMGRGAKGAAMYLRETGEITELPAACVGAVVNTVGAGDALFSAFLHFYVKGDQPEAALRRAQIFAAHKITVSGASNGFVTEEVIEKTI